MPPAEELAFRAMGSDAHIIVVGGLPGGAEAARRRIDDLERRWSRFLADSEISGLTRQAGEWVTLSPESLLLVERALEAWRLTVGRFDPTVLNALIEAGYDRSFDELVEENRGYRPEPPGAPLLGAASIEIEGNRVRLPAAVGFDPGGIGKGLAADLVAAETMAAGAAGVCVNLGGDLRVAGEAPEHPSAWTVAVEHPAAPEPLALLGLHDGAVATSTTLRRRWTGPGGEERHHLIDPWTGAPSTSDLTLAAVVAGEGWVAEVLAKAVLLRGSEHAFDLVAGLGADALIVDRGGTVGATPGLAAFLGGNPLPIRLPGV